MVVRNFFSGRRIYYLLALVVLGLPVVVVNGQDDDVARVALVIMDVEGKVETACVFIEGEEPTGYDVLVESGLDVNAAVSGLGTAVCAINETGCFAPTENCFCQCSGGRCNYWAYHYWSEDESKWIYSGRGSGQRVVSDGDVELWKWNTPENEDEPLPEMIWGDICENQTEGQSLEGNEASDDGLAADVLGYVAFGVIGIGVLGGLWWQRSRSR